MLYTIIFAILGIFFVTNLLLSFGSIKKPPIETGEEILSWYAPNKISYHLKIVIFSFSIIFLLPNFILFEIPSYSGSGFDFVNSVKISFISFQDLNSMLILFSIIYSIVIIATLNTPIKYSLTEKGVSYSFLLTNSISFYHWDDIYYYKYNKDCALIWFTPPTHIPDWEIVLDKKNLKKIQGLFQNKVKSMQYYETLKNKKEEVSN